MLLLLHQQLFYSIPSQLTFQRNKFIPEKLQHQGDLMTRRCC